MINFKILLTNQEQLALHDALHYLKMAELKTCCLELNLPHVGNKASLIKRIMYFVKTGQIKTVAIIPAISRAKNHPPQALNANSLMLYGQYKNDLKTRLFFKVLIGEYFHFTAFGIDWLNARWLGGNPPTYQEFANYWVQEYAQRKLVQAPPKAEWAFIKFLQKMQQEQLNLNKSDLLRSWKNLQVEQANLVKKLLAKLT